MFLILLLIPTLFALASHDSDVEKYPVEENHGNNAFIRPDFLSVENQADNGGVRVKPWIKKKTRKQGGKKGKGGKRQAKKGKKRPKEKEGKKRQTKGKVGKKQLKGKVGKKQPTKGKVGKKQPKGKVGKKRPTKGKVGKKQPKGKGGNTMKGKRPRPKTKPRPMTNQNKQFFDKIKRIEGQLKNFVALSSIQKFKTNIWSEVAEATRVVPDLMEFKAQMELEMETNNLRLEEALASLAVNASNPNLVSNLHASSDNLQQLKDIKLDILEVARVQNELKRNLTTNMEEQRRRIDLLETKMNITNNNMGVLETQMNNTNNDVYFLETQLNVTNNNMGVLHTSYLSFLLNWQDI